MQTFRDEGCPITKRLLCFFYVDSTWISLQQSLGGFVLYFQHAKDNYDFVCWYNCILQMIQKRFFFFFK